MKTTTSGKLFLEEMKAKIEKTKAMLKEESIKKLLESQDQTEQIEKELNDQKDNLEKMFDKIKDASEEEVENLSSQAEEAWDKFSQKWSKFLDKAGM